MTSLFMVMLFLCFLPWDAGQQIRDARRNNGTSPAHLASLVPQGSFSCTSQADCPENSYCEDKLCECFLGYFIFIDPHNGMVTCEQCPNVHETCSVNKCCYPPGFTTCHNNVCQCNDDFHASECSDMDEFKLATQIALGSALILAIACLLGVLWSSCRRRNALAGRRHQTRRREASLTSIQRFVQERLQHRPPDYYDRSHIRIEKPPSYEDTLEQWRKWKYDDQNLVANAPLRYPIMNAFAPTTTPDSQQQQQPHQQQEQQEIEMSQLNSDPRNRRRDEEICANRETNEVGGLAIGRDNPTFTITEEKDATIAR